MRLAMHEQSEASDENLRSGSESRGRLYDKPGARKREVLGPGWGAPQRYKRRDAEHAAEKGGRYAATVVILKASIRSTC